MMIGSFGGGFGRGLGGFSFDPRKYLPLEILVGLG